MILGIDVLVDGIRFPVINVDLRRSTNQFLLDVNNLNAPKCLLEGQRAAGREDLCWRLLHLDRLSWPLPVDDAHQ